jgi:DNA-binding PadR family transcriptional regulator
VFAIYRQYIETVSVNIFPTRITKGGLDMNSIWTEGFEPTRRQRGGRGRGHGPRHGHGFGEGWGGPMGGPPPWVAQMFGPGFGGGPGGRGGRRGGPRARRGDVRSAILDVLAPSEEGMNGYQVIQQIAERTDGAWKPSPGSVYPTIAQLQDEGLVEDAPSGRKALRLTDEGRTHVAEHAEEMAAVWAPFAQEADDEQVNFKQVIGQTVGAIAQVLSTGTPDQREKALDVLADTRRRLYGILAEGPDEQDDPDEDAPEGDSEDHRES